MARPLDCYIVDQQKSIRGPLDALQAHQVIQGSPFGCLLIRAGFPPVWSEDIEGVKIVLGEGHAEARLVPKAPSSRIMVKRNLFDGSRAFEVSCTTQYKEHKDWFENQKNLRANYPQSDVSDVQMDGHDRPGRFATTMVGPTRRILGSSVLIALMLGFATILQFSDLRGWISAPEQDSASDGFAPAPYLVFAGSVRTGGPGDVSFQARDSLGSRLLSTALERKLAGDGIGFLMALGEIRKKSELFRTEVLPPDVRTAALEIALLGQISEPEKISSQKSEPLLQLATAYQEILQAVRSEVGYDRPVDPVFSSNYLGAFSDADLSNAQLVYWGHQIAEQAGDDVIVNVDSLITKNLNQMIEPATAIRDGDHLRSWFLARALYFSLMYAAGKADEQAARNISALADKLVSMIQDDDREIIKLLSKEAQSSYSPEDLATRVGARLKSLGKLQATSDFLCRPGRSVLGHEFLIQTLRLTNAIGADLPGLNAVYGDCFVQPVALLPAHQRDNLGRPDELLDYMPLGLEGFSPEWQRFASIVRARALAEIDPASGASLFVDVSRDPQWQWRALIVFSSTDRALRADIANVFESMCQKQWETMDYSGSPFCLVSVWNRQEGVLVAQRRKLLTEIQSKFGRLDASEAFFQWLVWAYLTPDVLPGEPGNPLRFADKNQMRSLLDTDRPQLGTLDWYVRSRIQR